MSNQREKYLTKIDKNKRRKIEKVLEDIVNWKFDFLDITELAWFDNIFRCRIWNYRIIFEKKHWDIIIRQIRTRWDIYKHL